MKRIDYYLNNKQLKTLNDISYASNVLMDIDCFNVFVDDKNKRVTATLTNDCNAIFIEPSLKKLYGFSQCEIEDEFDENIGIRLAVNSLLKKIVDWSKSRLYEMADYQQKMILETLVKIKTNQQKLKRLLTKYSK